MILTDEQKAEIKNDILETLRKRGGCGGEFLRRTVCEQCGLTFGYAVFSDLVGELVKVGLVDTKMTGDGRRLFWLIGHSQNERT